MRNQKAISLITESLRVWIFAGLALAAPCIAGCKSATQPAPTSQSSPSPADYASSESPSNSGSEHRRSRRGRADAQAAPGVFDFYLLNLSWSPEFCATHNNNQECGHRLGFVVHGLWPQDENGDYPENCSDAPGPANPQAYTDLIPTASLVEHEWQTHGTCSGLTADAYFVQIRKAYTSFRIPANIGSGGDASGVTPGQLLQSFAQANPNYPAGSIVLSCGNNRLTAVEVCLTKNLQPEACQAVRPCRANVISVTAR